MRTVEYSQPKKAVENGSDFHGVLSFPYLCRFLEGNDNNSNKLIVPENWHQASKSYYIRDRESSGEWIIASLSYGIEKLITTVRHCFVGSTLKKHLISLGSYQGPYTQSHTYSI